MISALNPDYLRVEQVIERFCIQNTESTLAVVIERTSKNFLDSGISPLDGII
jgi:hypothetical protein